MEVKAKIIYSVDIFRILKNTYNTRFTRRKIMFDSIRV